MLDLMRKHARSWLIKVALGGVIIVFIFWYGWSGPGDQPRGYLAKVNGTTISADSFYRTYDSELEKIRLRFKGGIPPGLLEKMDLKKNVAMTMIHRVLLLQEGQRLGLSVTDQELRQDILSNPVFQYNGVFDERMYQEYLRTIKLTPALYEEERRKQIVEQQVAHLFTDSVKTDPEEIKRFWHFQSDKLVLSCLLLKPQEELPENLPDQKELETYFKDHRSKYEIPPSVDIQYAMFSWRDIQKQLTVSDEETRAYYQMNPKEFIVPEKIRAQHILIKIPPDADKEKAEQAMKRAEEIRQRVASGEDFGKVAAEVSEDEATKDKGGDLGLVVRGTVNPAIERAAGKLEPGQISEPVLTAQGYHIIRLEEKQPETQLSFDAVKEQIVNKLLEERSRKKINNDSEEFYETVYRTEDLEGPAAKFGFTVRSVEGLRKGGSIPDVGDEPRILSEAFDLKPGEISKLIRVGDNFVVLKLIKTTKERTPAIDEVKDQLAKDYLQAQALLKAKKKAADIIEELKATGQDPTEVAKKAGLTWEKLDPVSRTAGFVPRLGSSEAVAEMLTSLSEASSLYPSPIVAPQGIAVVRLAAIEPASEAQFEKEAPTVEHWVKEVRRTEFLQGWLSLLEKRSQIELNEKL